MLKYTNHASKMLDERGIDSNVCEYVIKHGYKKLTEKNSVLFYLPKHLMNEFTEALPSAIAAILPNLRVVTNMDMNIVITTYIKSPLLKLDKCV